MTFVSFASGSSGNCYLLTEGRAAVLLDTGISLRRIKTGLARRALTPDDLSAVLITHEHSDHVSGLDTFLKKLIIGGSILAVLLIPCVTPLHRSEAEELPVFTREQSTEAQNLETLCLR